MNKGWHDDLSSLRRDTGVLDEIRELVETDAQFELAQKWQVDTPTMRAVLDDSEELPKDPPDLGGAFAEAVVMLAGRPSLLIRNNSYNEPALINLKERLEPHRPQIENAITSVGRIELIDHWQYDWVGTAWMIEDGIAVTNRHVAELFSQRTNSGIVFDRNFLDQPVKSRIDFREEYNVEAVAEFNIEEIIYLSDRGPGYPDIALIRMASAENLPEPIPLFEGPLSTEMDIGVIGYPSGQDSIDPVEAKAISEIYKNRFDVKRFAPGKVSFVYDDRWYFVHDCSTLGGHSGSVVIDLATGRAIGLHFAGKFRRGNFAVTVPELLDATARPVFTTPMPADAFVLEARRTPASYADREGYDQDFLGEGFRAQIPRIDDKWKGDLAIVEGLDATPEYLVDYTHFSAAVSKSRKLPLYTTVNIDGDALPKEQDRPGDSSHWKNDPRIKGHLLDKDFYLRSGWDKGHMVRRLDPVWGSRETLLKANRDTYHYSNAAPQSPGMNRSGIWRKLEDYFLEKIGAEFDKKLTVLTGPVLDDYDPEFRGIKIPREYWKIAVWADEEAQEIGVAAFLLTQEEDVQSMLEFAFEEFSTVWVPLAEVEEKTGLKFDWSAFDRFVPKEGIAEASYTVITGPEDISLEKMI